MWGWRAPGDAAARGPWRGDDTSGWRGGHCPGWAPPLGCPGCGSLMTQCPAGAWGQPYLPCPGRARPGWGLLSRASLPRRSCPAPSRSPGALGEARGESTQRPLSQGTQRCPAGPLLSHGWHSEARPAHVMSSGDGDPPTPNPPAPHHPPGKRLRAEFIGSTGPGWWCHHPQRPRTRCSLPASQGWTNGQPRLVPRGKSCHTTSMGRCCPQAPGCSGASSAPGVMRDKETSRGVHSHPPRCSHGTNLASHRAPAAKLEAAGNWAVKPQPASGEAALAAAGQGAPVHPAGTVSPHQLPPSPASHFPRE